MASLAPPGESAHGAGMSHQFGWPVTSQKFEPAAESISMQTWWLPASSFFSTHVPSRVKPVSAMPGPLQSARGFP